MNEEDLDNIWYYLDKIEVRNNKIKKLQEEIDEYIKDIQEIINEAHS